MDKTCDTCTRRSDSLGKAPCWRTEKEKGKGESEAA